MDYRFEKYGLLFRPVEEEDASFILELRNNPALMKHLSPTSPDLEQQKQWIRGYKAREEKNEEIYFISEDIKGRKLGLNRLCNFGKECFEIGSWLYSPGLPVSTAIFGDFAARDFGFESLGFSSCKFEVRRANLSVVKYHLAFNPTKVGENDLYYYFSLSYNSYKLHRDKLLKILTYEAG